MIGTDKAARWSTAAAAFSFVAWTFEAAP